MKALFAGWLMTILTWLLLAAEGMGPRLVIIWLIGTLIVLGEFTHVIISGAEIFMAFFLGGDVAPTSWLTGSFGPILLGNVLGGVVFVTLLQYIQAQYEGKG
jgi:formate/nitrite transporter FocA (FNT family)